LYIVVNFVGSWDFMPWNDDLDDKSPAHGIAAASERFIRVVAGPGTGKSFAMKRRVARLLEEGANPKRILPVTFTNVAAEDLQREMLLVGVPGCEDIRGSTLHSLCLRILRRQNVFETLGRNPRPLNRFETEPLLYDLSSSYGDKRARDKRIRAYEAAWARLQHDEPGYPPTPEDQLFETDLVDWLKFHSGMLIGEIIPYVYQYLRDNPAAPERDLFDHVLVDEYQDLNKAEQGVVDLLTRKADLCIVGDDDQSLYSFKFAHPAGIRNFHSSHKDTVDHAIAECRRCPTLVVDMANALISRNRDRQARKLVARKENGTGIVEIIQYDSLKNEAIGIAEYVKNLVETQEYKPGEILILAQRRSIGNPIHDALVGRGIPSKSYYQEGILDNEAAQERLAILKLLVDRHDRIALRWLLGFGSSDFRKGAYGRLRKYCEEHSKEPFETLTQLKSGQIKISRTGQLLDQFQQIQAELERLETFTNNLVNFVPEWLLDTLGVEDPFFVLSSELSLESEDIPGLMEAVLKAVTQPDIPPEVAEVRIMSLHKSKGLSSPAVIISGCVEGLLPTAPDAGFSKAEIEASLEEQRRLLFVGLTRVKANPKNGRPGILLLTFSRSMSLADVMQSGIKPANVHYGTAYVHSSRFLKELGPAAPVPKKG
jgi:DNA helicase-2/ATP-dependent DNA helicase PcrA